jgi:peptide/nickel transport system substrate-binding protein
MHWHLGLTVALGLVVGCAGPAPSARTDGASPGTAGSSAPASQAAPARVSKTLVIGARYEPASLASKPLRASGSSVVATIRLFNAELDVADSQNNRPYLAEALPELNTDSWRVFPDGRMETTFKLRANTTWHDGTPLSAEDFAFAYQIYSNPVFAQAGSPPMKQMEDVTAPDARTVVFKWKEPYPDAAGLGRDFQPLPRHILEAQYERLDPEAFITQPYWTTEYVGLGPYRLNRWEQGSSVEGVAFDGHVLGRPKIDRVVVRYFQDENVALTNMLAGELHYATGRALRYEHGAQLKKDWGSTKGTVHFTPDTARFTAVQFRPDVQSPAAIGDVRVRKALVSSIDRQALNDGIFEGGLDMTHLYINRYSQYDRVQDMERAMVEAERAWTPYPYDPRRSEQLMTEAGFAKRDGLFATARGELLTLDVANHASPQYEKELAILVDTWEKAGFSMKPTILPSAALRDGQLRASFPGLYVASASRLDSYTAANISNPGNRWTGNNRGAWSNPEYDRLYQAFNATLDPAERVQQVAQMNKLLSDELPGWVLYYNPSVSANQSILRGPTHASPNTDTWDIHTWEMS